ncbi:MAG: hypothetical protein NC081_08875 [Roseburia sp.]|nr:hypothetical protein [Roseburia sp.]
MGRNDTIKAGAKNGVKKEALFKEALKGKHIPVLTLDNKWYRLLDELGKNAVREYEEQLNALLKRQGKLNSEVKDIKRLKKKLMNDIVRMVDEADLDESGKTDKKIEECKRLLEECNQKLEEYREELADIPDTIAELNLKLMLVTMEYCYDEMQENTREIEDIEQWLTKVRIELKKRQIYKQALERKNHEIYSYMHDIFGADVVNLFDMTYNPEDGGRKASEGREDAVSRDSAGDEAL